MLLLLIRHAVTASTGKTLYGTSPGVHLSEEGEAQARALAEHLSGLRIEALYSSPLERCRETAAALARGRGIRPRVMRSLSEVEYGDLTGRTFSSLGRLALWQQARRTPSLVRFPGGETLAEVQARAVRSLRELGERHPKETVAAVTHGDVIRLALAFQMGVPLDLYQRIQIDPASVSALSMDGGAPRILRLNDTGMLPRLA